MECAICSGNPETIERRAAPGRLDAALPLQERKSVDADDLGQYSKRSRREGPSAKATGGAVYAVSDVAVGNQRAQRWACSRQGEART
jgi:hypothetical protein